MATIKSMLTAKGWTGADFNSITIQSWKTAAGRVDMVVPVHARSAHQQEVAVPASALALRVSAEGRTVEIVHTQHSLTCYCDGERMDSLACLWDLIVDCEVAS